MWRTQLRTASFRNIRFGVTDSDGSFGRRVASHVFPKRDEPYSEDMGRKAREFRIDAFIVGDDYIRQRDRLIAACEAAGPGRLVHPYYGNRDVVCTGCDVRESSTEGGMARFILSFREAGALLYPAQTAKPKGVFSLLGSETTDEAIENFTEEFSVVGKPQNVADAAASKVETFSAAVTAQTAFITRNADEAADLAFTLETLQNDAATLVRTPETLATQITNSMRLISQATGNKRESLNILQTLFSFGAGDLFSPYNSVSNAAKRSNLGLMNNLVKLGALIVAAEDAVQIVYESLFETNSVRDSLFAVIDDLLGNEYLSQELYQRTQQYRAEIANSIPAPDQQLPSTFNFTPDGPTNSLAIAYRLYGSVDLETDIVDRNGIRNPALIHGQEALRVLRRG